MRLHRWFACNLWSLWLSAVAITWKSRVNIRYFSTSGLLPENIFRLSAHQTHRLSTWRFSWPYELGPCESYRQTVRVFDRSLTMVDLTYLRSARKHCERKYIRTLWLTKNDVEPLSNSGIYAKNYLLDPKEKNLGVKEKLSLHKFGAKSSLPDRSFFKKRAQHLDRKIWTHCCSRAHRLPVFFGHV